MMNDELLKNLSISCNHSKGTTFNYEIALRKYCNYFDMGLKDFLKEAEEDEMNGVKWKHSRLKSKLINTDIISFKTMLLELLEKR